MTLNEKIQAIQPQVFDKLIKYGYRWNPKVDRIKGKKTHDLLVYYSYKFVKVDLPSYITDMDFESIVFELFNKRTKNIKKVVPLILWLYDELQKVKTLEENYLSTPPDADMVMAGVDSLNELGEYATVDMLVKDWGIYTHKEVYDMPYHEVFNKLRLMKLQGDIQRKLANIQKEKSKRKH